MKTIKGFEIPLRGRLLKQHLELDQPMGLAYERSVSFGKDFHTHCRHMLVCPRSSTVMRVSSEVSSFDIDRRHILWVPQGILHDDQAISTIYDTLALFPGSTFVNEMIKDNQLRPKEVLRLIVDIFLVKRNVWIDNLIDRYFFERLLNPSSPKGCVFFLEKQILNEFCRLAFKPESKLPCSEIFEANQIALKVFEYIEAHLFESFTLDDLVKLTGSSVSTLTRKFKASFGLTPMSYVKNRRLDEALDLVKAKDYRVSDISLIVGYEDVTTFSKAFKAKFGKYPTQIQ